MFFNILLIFQLLISYTFGIVSYNDCQFELTDSNGMTAEYDLRFFNLQNDNEVFTVHDTQNTYFYYQFNICGHISTKVFTSNTTIPEACSHPNSPHPPCIKTQQLNTSNIPQCILYEDTVGTVPSALQVDTIDNDTKCYWLGMEIETNKTNVTEYKKALFDPNDAGKGVIFTILNGEWCESVGRNRELRIKLECPDDMRIEFEPRYHQQAINQAVVEEIDTCIYELTYSSPLACPSKCASRMNLEMYAVCATHGICEADPYGNGADNYPKGSLRCLCDDGYKGLMCQEINNEIKIIDQTHPGLLAAIVICIILLGVAIVCAAVLCHKIRMKELHEQQSMDHLSGGMLHDAGDANLAKMKTDAMTMNIGVDDGNQLQTATGSGAGSGVQLQTLDDHLESDKDKNQLLQHQDDDGDDDDDVDDDNDDNNDDNDGDNNDNDDDDDVDDDTAGGGAGGDDQETNPGGDD